jgi:hypothetical protein
MDRTERFYMILGLLRRQTVVSFATLQAALEVSRSTLKRDLSYLSTRLNNPSPTAASSAATALKKPMAKVASPTSCRGCGSRPLKFMPC